MSTTVQITRFLNPDDAEDAEYLVGQPPPPPGKVYLGVFMVVTNETDDARPSVLPGNRRLAPGQHISHEWRSQ